MRRTKEKKFGIEEYGLAFFANVAENRRESHSCTYHHPPSCISNSLPRQIWVVKCISKSKEEKTKHKAKKMDV